MAVGAFDLLRDGDSFNLKPKDAADPIPEDQREVARLFYELQNALLLLREEKIFAENDSSFSEFKRRGLEAAEVGCTYNNPKTTEAKRALQDIREDVLHRKGRPAKYRYLVYLGIWAVAAVILGFAVVLIARYLEPSLTGYGWVMIGATIGAWLSLAARRREVSFESLTEFLDYRFEPPIRLAFAALLVSVLALFLQKKLLAVAIGGVDLATFADDAGLALILGAITGFSEKAVSSKVIDRARSVFA